MRNSRLEQKDQVIAKFSEALEFAKVQKAKKDAARQQSLEGEGGIFEKIDRFLRGDRPKPEWPPPQEPPTE